jgi:hypothetical protein
MNKYKIGDYVEFKDPIQIKDDEDPYDGKWYIVSEKGYDFTDYETDEDLPELTNVPLYLCSDGSIIVWEIMVSENPDHESKMFFDTDAEAKLVKLDHILDHQSNSPTVKSEPLFND